MPFEAPYRHEIWTSDVSYAKHSIPGTGRVYVVSIPDNYSRAILAGALPALFNNQARRRA